MVQFRLSAVKANINLIRDVTTSIGVGKVDKHLWMFLCDCEKLKYEALAIMESEVICWQA